MEFRIVGDDVGLDVLGHRFVDIALAELRIAEAGPVANQFVRQRSADAGEDEVPDGVLQHRAVADFEDVAEVRLVAAGPRLGERHVADSAGDLGQLLGRDLGVGLPADAMVGQEPVDDRVIHDLLADQVDGRLADDADVLARIESHGWIPFRMKSSLVGIDAVLAPRSRPHCSQPMRTLPRTSWTVGLSLRERLLSRSERPTMICLVAAVLALAYNRPA